MELVEQASGELLQVWLVLHQRPVLFSLLGVASFVLGYAIAYWYLRREIRILGSLGEVLEQRIKRQEQDKARLVALLRPQTADAFCAIHEATSHKIDVPYPQSQLSARPEYNLLLHLGMIKIEPCGANQSLVMSTSEAAKLWEDLKLPFNGPRAHGLYR